MTGLFV
jgi:hypothetical protein